MSNDCTSVINGAFGRLLSAPDVCERLGCSPATLYRRVGAGLIPKPLRLGSSSRWTEREIDALISQAIALRDDATKSNGDRS
jgi:predicted DNA-binding transcriptional regulator AlpA